jgi:hypothetical protein
MCALLILVLWLVFDAKRDDDIAQEATANKLASAQESDRHHEISTAVMNLACPYDPAKCLAVERFSPIVRHSRCLFAKGAKLWGSKDYNEAWSLEENVRASVPTFLQMLLRGETEVRGLEPKCKINTRKRHNS